jgi:WD40 repeat protein
MLTRRAQGGLLFGLAVVAAADAHAAGPPGSPARADGDGRALPPGAIARLGTRRGRLPGIVRDFALTADGKCLAVQIESRAGTSPRTDRVLLLDLATKETLRTFALEDAYSRGVALSADGKRFVEFGSLGSGPGRIWDLETAKVTCRLPQGGGRAVFSPDGKALAVLSDHDGLFILSTTTGKLLHTLPAVGHHHRPVFSPDGKVVYSGDRKGWLTSWDVATGNLVRKFDGRVGAPSDRPLAISADGRLLAAVSRIGPSTIDLWDVRTGTRLHRLLGDRDWDHAVAFSPDGKLLASQSEDVTIRLWDVATGKELRRLDGHGMGSNCLTFSRDGKSLISGGGGRAIHIWEVDTGKKVWPPDGHWDEVYDVAVSPDGKTVASGSADGTIRLWGLRTGTALGLRGKPWRRLSSVVFSPDGKLLASANDFTDGGRLIRVDTGAELCRLNAGALGFAEGGKALVCVDDRGRVGLYRWREGGEPRWLSPDGKGLFFPISLSANGNVLVGRETLEDHIVVWDLPAWKERALALGDRGGMFAISPDGRLLARDERGAIVVRDLRTGAPIRRWEGEHSARAFSLDGRTLVAADRADGSVVLLEMATGKVRRRFENGAIEPPAYFSPDGRFLVTGCADTTALVWDLAGCGRPRLAPRELEALAADLAGPDAARAYRAVWALAAAKEQAPAFLLGRLRPMFSAKGAPMSRWAVELGGDDYERRERAERELRRLGELAEPALRDALAAGPPLEYRLRLERLLRALEYPQPTPARLLAVRSVEALEQAGTPEARRALLLVARAAPGSWLRREANASLGRLDRRSAAAP